MTTTCPAYSPLPPL
jgi:tubulin-folding cofactor B